ncbi:hypothetical protein [Bdellovibrio sp.]|uniref:hypothetical protein n=1 Tax=Bdellovibrio sp. TaxID=28201 RepID=UPI0039E632FC
MMSVNRFEVSLFSNLFMILLTVFGLSGCTLSAELIKSSVDPNRSKIVVPDPAQGIADGVSSIKVLVYAKDDQGQTVEGFTPDLFVFGFGEHKTQCEVTRAEYASCTLSATEGGQKLIFTKNAVILQPGIAYFGDDLSLSAMTVKKNNVPANGTAKALIEFVLKDSKGTGKAGVQPELFVKSPASVKINCSVTDHLGISQCRLSAITPGIYTIHSNSPSVLPVEVIFTEPVLKVLESRAFADGTSKVKIEVKTSVLPTLKSQPADVSIACAGVSGGKSLCQLSSLNVGTKVIGVDVPSSIDEVVEVFFANNLNTIRAVAGTQPRADGYTEYQIEVVLKEPDATPSVGVVPFLEIEGSGVNRIRCQTTNSSGVASCFVSSTEAGTKRISVTNPLVKDVLVLEFLPAVVSVLSQNVPADGHSPVIVEIATEEQIGVVPVLEVSGPEGAKTKYMCTPSLKTEGATETKSLCYITSETAGDYSIKLLTPIQTEFPISFVSVNSLLKLADGEDGSAKANNIETIELKVVAKNSLGVPRVGFTPVLQISGSGVSYVCSPVNVLGEATCTLKSNKIGSYLVEATDPQVYQKVTVEFTSPTGGIAADNPGLNLINQLTSVTDPSSFAIIYLDLKDASGNPIQGVVPVLDIQGTGENNYICYPSDANGKTYCKINSTESGTKLVRVVQPALPGRITLNVIDNVRTCSAAFSASTEQVWQGPDLSTWGPCTVLTCEANYTLTSNTCVANTRSCLPMPVGGKIGTQTWDSRNTDKTWGLCTLTSCLPNYTLSGASAGNSCDADTRSCPSQDLTVHAIAGDQTWNGVDWGVCKATNCEYPYKPQNFVCVSADIVPTLTGFFVDVVKALPDQEYTSQVLVVGDVNRNIPISVSGGINSRIETRRLPGTWISRGSEITIASLSDPQEGLINGDEIRIVSTAASTLVTTTTVTLKVGGASDLNWNITTTNALPPHNPILTHLANMNSFSVSWGAGGVGNDGAGGCKLQYFKDQSVWTDLIGSYDCDAPQSTMTVSLPSDGWTNNFNVAGVAVRLAHVTDGSEVLTFTDRLTCVSEAMMPKVNNPLKDENCNGLWSDEDDNLAPLGGGFTISATDVGDSSITGSTSVVLNITCPADQAGGVQMAFGNSPNSTNWTSCVASQGHTLVSGSGVKDVYVRFKDQYDNMTADYSQSITLDQTAPSGGSLTINGGAAKTNNLLVTLDVVCPTDNNPPIEMAFGEMVGPTNWTSCAATTPFTLSGGDGTKVVHIRFKDKFGNISADATANIQLDQSGPVSTLSYTNGWTNTLSLLLNVAVTDAGGSSPLTCSIEMQEASIASGVSGAYGAFSEISNSCVSTTVPVLDGKAYKFRMISSDSLGNVGSSVAPAYEVKIDTVLPVISAVSATTTATEPACGTVRVSVTASDDSAGMAATAYSFDGGVSWQASASKDFSTTSLNLGIGTIQVRDSANNVTSYNATVTGSATTCYTYSWQTTGWGSCSANPYWGGWDSCSASCGGGTQYRTCYDTWGTQSRSVWCQRSDGATVADGFCSGAKPDTSTSCYSSCSGSSSQSCNTQACIACASESAGYRVIWQCGGCSLTGLPNGSAGQTVTGYCGNGSHAQYQCVDGYGWSLVSFSEVCN